MKTRYWIVLFAALLLICGVLSAFLLLRRPDGTVANVYRDGELIYSVDLSNVTETYEIKLDEDTHQIEPGRIRVVDSVCRDHICEETGWIGDRSFPIVCLPHRLVIRVEKQSAAAVDAVSQ